MEYEYSKVITYGNHAEVYRYELRPRRIGISRAVKGSDGVSRLSKDGQDATHAPKQKKIRTEANARSASMAFRRLVAANLGGLNNPVLLTLTYRENITDLDRSRKDFNTFAKRAKGTFGGEVRYIVVAEFQERGAIHFHALVWGIPESVVNGERSSRLVAGLWGQGFVDIKKTDGHVKLATYLSKYMKKMFIDPRLAGRKAYISSQNCIRPVIDKDCILSKYFYGVMDYDLSTGGVLENVEYDTQWLGRALYKKYVISPRYVQARS